VRASDPPAFTVTPNAWATAHPASALGAPQALARTAQVDPTTQPTPARLEPRRAFGARLQLLRASAQATRDLAQRVGKARGNQHPAQLRVRAWQKRLVAWAAEADNHLQAAQAEPTARQLLALHQLQTEADVLLLEQPPAAAAHDPAQDLQDKIAQTQRELTQDLQALSRALGLLGFMQWAFDPQAPYPAFDIEHLLSPEQRTDLCFVLTTLIQLEELASALSTWAQQAWQLDQLDSLADFQVRVLHAACEAQTWAEEAAARTRKEQANAQAKAGLVSLGKL
jgi:hypothetical protein